MASKMTVAETFDAFFGPGSAEATLSPEDLAVARQPYDYVPPAPGCDAKIKVTAHSVSPAHPGADPGPIDGGTILMIHSIPQGTPLSTVVQRVRESTIVTRDVVICYAELGPGRIVRDLDSQR